MFVLSQSYLLPYLLYIDYDKKELSCENMQSCKNVRLCKVATSEKRKNVYTSRLLFIAILKFCDLGNIGTEPQDLWCRALCSTNAGHHFSRSFFQKISLTRSYRTEIHDVKTTHSFNGAAVGEGGAGWSCGGVTRCGRASREIRTSREE